MTSRKALVIMAKAPSSGAVKTRLCPPLDAVSAAELYRCFILDTFQMASGLEGVQVVVAYAPRGTRGAFKPLLHPGFQLVAQVGADLGERMANVLAHSFRIGFEQVVLIGADIPTLPGTHLEQAFILLAQKQVDVVLGPSEDGGYYLIGLKRPFPDLFRGVPMSTEMVLARTLDRAKIMELGVALLPPWYDVDTGDDLIRLKEELSTTATDHATHTRRFLLTLKLPYPSETAGG